MIAEKVKYTDYNGNDRVETCYFNLTKAELFKLNQEYGPDGLEAYASKLIEENNTGKMVELFSDILARSYGFRSEDGTRFIKDKDKTESFMTSEAYSELLISVLSDPEKAKVFTSAMINMPAK